MKATINLSLRIPKDQARYIQRAAKNLGKPVATYVRERAIAAAVDYLYEIRDPLVVPK